MSSRAFRNLFLLWLAWIFILYGFQAWAAMRFQVMHPDYALEWTSIDSAQSYKLDRPYLNEPFMNQQVAYDSEYYLSIATIGYADPKVASAVINGEHVPLNYAFLPIYPVVMRVVAFPLKVFQLSPIATSTLAGVIVSVFGTLAGMMALYDLAHAELGDDGGWRAAFYLLIFPTGFFLAMVYTEGLFIGLAFGTLALIRRRQWSWAVVLAILATWTRAVGVLLVIPLVVAFYRSGQWRQINLGRAGLKQLGLCLLMLAPLASYFIWRYSYWGHMFQLVEDNIFGRQLLNLRISISGWASAFHSLFSTNPQTTAYYMVEFGTILLGILASIFTIRRYPEVASFSLAAILISLTSGYPQSMARYVLTAPAIFIFLSRLGKRLAFDRAWSILSTMLMGALAFLFAADMWVG